MSAFLARVRFSVLGSGWLPASSAPALYRLDRDSAHVLLVVPGPDRGPDALDLYTREIARSGALAREAGARVGPVGSYRVGALAVQELKAVGPDGLVLVFLQLERRRPS